MLRENISKQLEHCYKPGFLREFKTLEPWRGLGWSTESSVCEGETDFFRKDELILELRVDLGFLGRDRKQLLTWRERRGKVWGLRAESIKAYLILSWLLLWFSNQGSKDRPRQRKCGVLTTGPPGNSHDTPDHGRREMSERGDHTHCISQAKLTDVFKRRLGCLDFIHRLRRATNFETGEKITIFF